MTRPKELTGSGVWQTWKLDDRNPHTQYREPIHHDSQTAIACKTAELYGLGNPLPRCGHVWRDIDGWRVTRRPVTSPRA